MMENAAITDTQLYETFRGTLGIEKAEKTVGAIRTLVRSEMENQTQILATREELSRTREELKADIAATREQIASLEIRMVDRFHSAQFKIIFWIVSIGILQFVASYLLKGQ